jgi:hypothetical protein
MKRIQEKMLTFNQKGYLTPNTVIQTDIEQVEKEFVIEYSSMDRSRLFDQYRRYIKDLKTVCGDLEIKQWINGSFVTKCKPNPSDIDMVVFIDGEVLKRLGEKVKPFTYPFAKNNYKGIDAYIVGVFPVEDGKHKLFKSDKGYWHDQFDSTRRNRNGKKERKGFVEVCF